MGETLKDCNDLELNLKKIDRKILDELGEGDRTIGALSDYLNEHRNSVRGRLDVLETLGAVERIHDPTALYTLNHDPRRAC